MKSGQAALLAIATCLLVPVASASTTWVLPNGDRLTGELVRETASRVTIKHPVLGELEFPRQEPAPKPETQAAPLPPKPKTTWKRQLDFGLTQAGGVVDQRSLNLRLQLDGRIAANTLRLTAGWADAESAGTTLTARRDAELRCRHEATARRFIQTLTNYEADPVRGLDLAAEQQIGGGYRLIADKHRQLNAGVGLAGLYRETSGLEPELRMLGSLFQDYSHTWRSGIKFTQEARVGLAGGGSFSPRGGGIGGAPVPAGDDDYRVQFRAGLEGRLSESTKFNLRYEYDYDESLTTPANRRLTTSLGYVW